MEQFFFNSWQSLFRTLVVGVLAYVALVFFLRISGKRTLSKLNAFDLVVTVTLGSTLATVLLSRDVSLADGVLALALLVGLQFVVTWSSMRARWIRKLVTGEPHMLLYRGDYVRSALYRARVTEDSIFRIAQSPSTLSVPLLSSFQTLIPVARYRFLPVSLFLQFFLAFFREHLYK